jgi:hypothetical protein
MVARYRRTEGKAIRMTDSDAQKYIHAPDRAYSLLILMTTKNPDVSCRYCPRSEKTMDDWAMSHQKWNTSMTPARWMKQIYRRKGLMSKLGDVETLLSRYAGKEHIVLREATKKYKTQKQTIFPVIMEYEKSYETFDRLGVQHVPHVVLVLPSGRKKVMSDFKTEAGSTTEALSAFVKKHLKIMVPIVRSPSARLHVAIVLAAVLAFVPPTSKTLRTLTGVVTGRWAAMVACLVVFFSSVGGMVYCIIKAPPIWHMGNTGLFFMYPSSSHQLVGEGIVVGLLHLGLAVCIVMMYKVSGDRTVLAKVGASSGPTVPRWHGSGEAVMSCEEKGFPVNHLQRVFVSPRARSRAFSAVTSGEAQKSFWGRSAMESRAHEGEWAPSSGTKWHPHAKKRLKSTNRFVWLAYFATTFFAGCFFSLWSALQGEYERKVSWYSAGRTWYGRFGGWVWFLRA